MFTLTEADDYHDQMLEFGTERDSRFRRSIISGGWAVHNGRLSETEESWVREFEDVPDWLARSYNEDIFSFNRESLPLWTELQGSEPAIFEAAGLRNKIVRLYADRDHLRQALARQNGAGATLAVLATDEIRDHYPALSDACAAGAIAGGIEVVGFTVNVHTFMARLIDRLETQGVQFRWSQRFTRLERNSAGMVTGAVTDAGVQRADHYVICPGAYGRGLLAGTRSAHKVHGVLGCWLTVPNVPPRLENSIKIARRGFVAEDTNVTVAKNAAGEDVMIFGSGYGYTGENPANVSGAQLEALYLAVEDTVRRYFPKSFASAGGAMPTRQTRRFCVRPWTSSCLGIFEVIPARGGIAVVVGGHNTGGFAQGPSVAEAVVAAVAGRYHPMHASYDPDRLERFRRIDTGLSSW